jgi:hypothetical protein
MSWKKIIGKGAGIVGGAVGFVVGGPAGASAGFAIGGAIGGAVAGNEAESQMRKAKKQERRLAQLQALRQRKELIREVQFQNAAAMTRSLGAGIGIGSSMIQGQQASARTSLTDDLGFHGEGGDIGDRIWRHTKRADQWASIGAMSQTIGQIGSAAMGVVPTGGSEFVNLPKPGTVPSGGTPVVWDTTTPSRGMGA